MKKILLFLALIITVTLSCKKIDGPPAHHDRLKSILFGKDTLSMYVGETRQVPIMINPSDYHLDSLKWKSSDTTVLAFSSTGLLTAKKTGTSTISVSNLTNTISISALVTVLPAPKDTLKMGLIAYYPFDNNAVDSSGNGHNGTLSSNVTATTDRFGHANSAYYFSGDATSYIMVDDNTALRLNNTDFSINVWVNMTTYQTSLGSHIMSKRNPGDNDGYTYSVNGSGAVDHPLGSLGFGPGGDGPDAYSTAGINLGNWHMLTLVYKLSKNQVSYYIDGVYNTSVDNIASPNGQTDAPLYIGKDNPAFFTSYFLNGSLDELRIYNRDLSTHEINVLFTHN